MKRIVTTISIILLSSAISGCGLIGGADTTTGNNVTNTTVSQTVYTETRSEINTESKNEKMYYTVVYHEDEEREASEIKTVIEFGNNTTTESIESLGFHYGGKRFAGWKVFREIDDSWWVKDKDGNKQWKHFKNNALTDGYEFIILPDKVVLSKSAESGIVHLYATWDD